MIFKRIFNRLAIYDERSRAFDALKFARSPVRNWIHSKSVQASTEVFFDLHKAAVIALWMLILLLSYGPVHADDALTRPSTLSIDGAEISLAAVPLPNVSNIETAVQKVLHVARSELAELIVAEHIDAQALAAAYGELGVLYHSHHIYVPAQPCYRNASALTPEVFRWPYYLGYLAQQSNALELAERDYRKALAIRPDYAPAQLRLAQVYIDQNRIDLAKPLLERTVRMPGLEGASLFGLGQIAYSQRDHARAVELLNQALQKRPQASRIHYTLAMSYRALGEVDQARSHLAQYGDGKPEIADPEMDQLSHRAIGVKTHYHQALEAVRTRQYDVAAKAFAKALEQEPDNVNARISLARTQYLSGEPEAALENLRESVRRDPNNPLAHFLLGVLLDERGQQKEAISSYRETLRLKPEHAGAHHYLGNTLFATGHYSEAARHLAEAYRLEPQDSAAQMLEAIALMRSAAPHQVIKARLETLYRDHPQRPMVAYALARLLAASPENEVRDGERALRIVQKSLTGFMPLMYSETLAMAYAELGRFEEAIAIQNDAISAAYSMAIFNLLPRLEQTLALYSEKKPSRTPWSDDDPMFFPMPIDVAGPFRDYPAARPY
jgi:tetratricopeptide (TPR) repeat protein